MPEQPDDIAIDMSPEAIWHRTYGRSDRCHWCGGLLLACAHCDHETCTECGRGHDEQKTFPDMEAAVQRFREAQRKAKEDADV